MRALRAQRPPGAERRHSLSPRQLAAGGTVAPSLEARSADTALASRRPTTRGLFAPNDWLAERGCTHVAMEATGVYWKPVRRVLQCLLDPLHVLALLPHKLLAGAGQVAQLLDGRRRHEARADEPRRGQEGRVANEVSLELGHASLARRRENSRGTSLCDT